jgi:arylformamidase
MRPYRGYDQAGLDAQYNLRARWPEHAAFMRDWSRDGARARTRPGWVLDLAHGPTEAERLDLRRAEGLAPGGRAPLIAFFHGGYWKALDKQDVCFLAEPFARAGIAFAAIGYALAPTVSLDEIARQARAAIAFLWRHAPGFGIDSRRIIVAGHSAGGHLAALLATDDRRLYMPIAGAFCLSGVYDLEPLRLSYHNAELRLDRAAASRLSPVAHAPRPSIDVVLAVGGDETAEFLRQQAEFARAWARTARVRIVPAPGLHHFDIVERFADRTHPIGRAAFELALARA